MIFSLFSKYFSLDFLTEYGLHLDEQFHLDVCRRHLNHSDKSVRYSCWFGLHCLVDQDPAIVLKGEISAVMQQCLMNVQESFKIIHKVMGL